ncbi:MAB_1171c family putative transporter [Streptomyces sp. NPDC001674]|uniref:MAB_1171c family putative transporter n=1 Tax=Streptomyces sp. NPDC001674 TaxID=3154394 RepID=UPI00332CFDF2
MSKRSPLPTSRTACCGASTTPSPALPSLARPGAVLSDFLTYAIVLLLLVQALWRVPSALRGRVRERSLWGAFAVLACAWLMRTDLGRHLVEGLGVDDLATLLKHCLTVAGLCVLLRYIAAVYRGVGSLGGETNRRARVTMAVQHYGVLAAALVVIVMAVVFLFVLHREPVQGDSHFMHRHAGEPALALYMPLFYAYCGTVITLAGYQWAAAARTASRRTLKTGLTLMAAGMAAGVLYAAVRAVYAVLVALHPVSEGSARTQEIVTDTLLYLSFLLWAVGVIAPATQAAVNRVRAYRMLAGLHALWRDLALTAPDLVRHAPSSILPRHPATDGFNVLRDLVSHDPTPHVRLGRYVTEIRDVIHTMRRRAPEDLYQLALELAESEGHTGQDAEAAAQAYWIMAARLNMRAPVREPGVPAEFPSAGEDFLSEEVPWLLRVCEAYAQADPAIAGEVLEDSLPPHEVTT